MTDLLKVLLFIYLSIHSTPQRYIKNNTHAHTHDLISEQKITLKFVT